MGCRHSKLRRIAALIVLVAIVITGMPNTVHAQAKNYIMYQIKDGDTIKKIADRYNTSVNSIMELNNIKNSNVFYSGKEIKVPIASVTYVVKKGDTLSKIAVTHGTTVDTIAKLNAIKDVNKIQTGQKLIVVKEEHVASVNNEETLVKTQKELLNALASKSVTVIRIATEKKVTFEIPKKNYNAKVLIVDAKNSEVKNEGTFHQILIQAIKTSTFYENGSKNTIIIKAPKAHLVMEKTAVPGKVIVEDTNKELTIDNHTKKQMSLQTSKEALTVKAENSVEVKQGIVKRESKLNQVKPTAAPTTKPTVAPTTKPTATPTVVPTTKPTVVPTITPTGTPNPTNIPTAMPEPTSIPTDIPTPTPIPPTEVPTISPTPVPQLPSDIVDFLTWKLQLPIAGESGLSVKEVSPEDLNNGFVHDEYFYVDTDGGIVFHCPVDGFKTANTNYARTELREMIDGKNPAVNWGFQGTHILRTSESVEKVSSNGRTVVSQIHGIYPNGDNGPVLVKVQYEHDLKAVVVMLKTGTAPNAAEQRGYFYGVELGQRFDTEIKCVDGVLYVTIQSEGRKETYTINFMEMDSTWGGQLGYFKVGNYIQDSDVNYENEAATVKVYSIETFHDDSYVEQVPIEGLAMKQTGVTLGIGETIGLEPVFTPVDTTNKTVTWSVVSGQDKVAVNKYGVVTAIAEGEAIVRATSEENNSVFAECVLTVTLDSKQEVIALYEQNFGNDMPYDITNASEWLLSTTGYGKVDVEQEGDNFILKLTDTDMAGTAKSLVYFPEQYGTTTLSYRIRVDEILVKDPDGAKAQASYLYLPVGGQDGFMNAADEMFRIRNGATYQGGTLVNHRWQLSHSYSDATMNYAATEFKIGEWKEITVVITPDNGTANANKTDVYVDGYRVASQMNNNKINSYINQAEFYTGSKDQVSFSIDDVRIYSGEKITEAEDALPPTSITLGAAPSTMATGDSFKLTTYITPTDAKEAVTYLITSGADLVSVSKDGLVTAIKPGTATIRVHSTGHEEVFAEITLTIVEGSSIVRVESINLPEKIINLTEGEEKQLFPILLPLNATEQKVSYEVIRGFDVISVSVEGLLSTKNTGVATVRITCMDNSRLYVDCDISVTRKTNEGTVIFRDTFNEPLDLTKWTLATSNFNDTITEVKDGALHLVDNNTSGQPRAYVSFEPQASTFSIEFKVKMSADTIYNSNKVSALCVAFGTGTITTTASETLRFKTSADVVNGVVTNRRFVYSKEEGASGFYDLSKNYELEEWYTVKLVTTPNDGSTRANTTDIYINDTLMIEGVANKTNAAIIDKLIFQTGTADLTEFWIDDVTITAGNSNSETPGENPGFQLVYEEDFENGSLPEASSTTNPSIRPSWKLTTGGSSLSEIALDTMENSALKLSDSDTSSQPKAQLIFNPITDKATIEFRLKMESDKAYIDGTNQKASAFCVVFGSTSDGNIATKANEMFRFKTTATVDTASGSAITHRKYQYENSDGKSFVTLDAPNYELNTYYTIKFVITLGDSQKTEIYIDGVKVAEGFHKKNTNTVDTILFQSGSMDLTEYWIDNIKIYQGHNV